MSGDALMPDSPTREATFLAEPVGCDEVMKILYKVEPYGSFVPNYSEIAEAIARASTEDPLFPHRADGSRLTAAILIASAYQSSRFHPNLIGQQGKKFGLWQIEPPTARVLANIMLTPKTAAYVFIDLVRTSFIACAGRTWEEALSWLMSSGGDPKEVKAVKASMDRMLLATKIAREAWPSVSPPRMLGAGA